MKAIFLGAGASRGTFRSANDRVPTAAEFGQTLNELAPHVLGHLIDEFGQRKRPFLRRKHVPLEMLRFLMRENAMSIMELGKVLGNKTAASLVVNGKRELSKTHIRRLSARFNVDPGLFF
jgi:antitoxin component HigA of HigAB toxin-antitoxin module